MPYAKDRSREKKLTTFHLKTMAMSFKMAITGMNILEECHKSFMDLKWKRVHKYIVYKIDEGTRAVKVDKVGGPSESYEDLAASLPHDDCRYAVFDFNFINLDNFQMSKIFFITWAPTSSRIRAKMLYATSKQGLRAILEGVHNDMQATDETEMGIDIIKDRAK